MRSIAPALPVLTALAIAAPAAHGQHTMPAPFTVVIANPVQTVAPGQTAYFTGTVTNVSGVAQPTSGYLINYAVGYYSAGIGSLPANFSQGILSQTSFAAGGSYSGLLFSTTPSATATTGLYTGNGFFFEAYTYVPGSNVSSQVNPAYYTINVTPEPSQSAALALGALGLAGLAIRAQRRAGA